MRPDDLSELALLYALDTLDEAEQSWVEEQCADTAGFQAEVAELESVAAMLAYGVELPPIAPDLKARLFQKIAAEEDRDRTEIATLLEQVKTATWEPYRFAPGVQVATAQLNLETREVNCFVRSFSQVKFPQHRHAATEEILVLEGDLKIGDRVYGKGDRIQSQPGTVHQPETLTGCVLFLRTSIDDELLL